jgi:2-keto-4-pentenoate hydratase
MNNSDTTPLPFRMNLQKIVARQLEDYDRRKPGTIFSDPDFRPGIEDAYQLQFEVARLRELRGERVAGYKIGCISRTMQDQLGLDRPVFGHVWASELRSSGAVLDMASFDGLAIEGEFAVRLAADVPSAVWLKENPEAFSAGFIVIELHNYVFRGGLGNRAAELIANNAIHAGLVLPVEETSLKNADAMLDASLRVLRNGEVLGEGSGQQLEGGPLASVLRLVEHLEKHGRRLLRGHIVLTGSPLPLWQVSAGDRIEVRCDPFGKAATAVAQG